MVFRNFFKRKPKKEPTEKSKEVKEKKPPEAIPEVEPRKVRKVSATREKKTDTAYKILKSPQVTEKSTDLVAKNQYTFKVWPMANKIEIKKAIENLYDIDVLSVKIIKVPAKRRRLGKTSGWRSGYKKAIVRLAEGQKIEVLPR